MAVKKPTVEQVYGAMQAIRNLGLDPRYFNVESVARAIAKEKPHTLELVRKITARHFDGPDSERP